MVDRSRYGIDGNGHLRSVDEVERGLKCGLICTTCRQPLKARKGPRRIHHLSHHNPNMNCTGSLESQLHFLAKEVLRDAPKIRLPDLKMFIDGLLPRELAYVPILCGHYLQCDRIVIEETRDDLRIDAIASSHRGEIAIEIEVSHKVTEEKAAKLSARGIPCFEVDLSGLQRWDIGRDEVRAAVISDAPRKWLVDPIAYFAPEYADCEAEAVRFKAYLKAIRPRFGALANSPVPKSVAPSSRTKIDEEAWILARKRFGIPDPPPPPPGLTQDQVEAIRVYFPNWLQDKYP